MSRFIPTSGLEKGLEKIEKHRNNEMRKQIDIGEGGGNCRKEDRHIYKPVDVKTKCK